VAAGVAAGARDLATVMVPACCHRPNRPRRSYPFPSARRQRERGYNQSAELAGAEQRVREQRERAPHVELHEGQQDEDE
jgi:hypothetical protein